MRAFIYFKEVGMFIYTSACLATWFHMLFSTAEAAVIENERPTVPDSWLDTSLFMRGSHVLHESLIKITCQFE